MALALYRKYRPATFAEVVGQEHVTDPLRIALGAGRVNHAYLFSGPRGCGKTSSARILARSLNCEQGPTPDPCGTCESCLALAPEGPGSIDVVELDAASHGGVDDARELRDRAFYAPAGSRYRVFIIDEAHMVTTQGFNALLKIVEEPPEHLVFVFATTEPEKVLPTIRSRTHHYPFRLIPPGAMRELLERNCADEGVAVEPAVFPLVIRAGGGSARDTQSVLDQLLSGAGPAGVTYDRAVALLGVTDVALIDDVVDGLAADDAPTVFGTVDRLVEAGHDPRRFCADLLDRLRDLVLLRAVPDAASRGLVSAPADELDRMVAQAQRIGPAALTRHAEILHTGLTEMRGATAPRLLLELLCARMLLPAALGSGAPSDHAADAAVMQRLERLERRAGAAQAGSTQVGVAPAEDEPSAAPARTPARPSVSTPAPSTVERSVVPPADPPVTKVEPVVKAEPEPIAEPTPTAPPTPPPPATTATPTAGGLDAAQVRNVWSELLGEIRKQSRSAEAMLTNATVQSVDGNAVVIAHTAAPLARRLAEGRNPEVIAAALRALFGGDWLVRVVHADGAAGSVPASPPPVTPQRPAPTRPSAAATATAVATTAPTPARPQISRPSESRSAAAVPPEPPEPDEPLPPEPEDEEELLAEAARPVVNGEPGSRHDPEEEVLRLLADKLGARPIESAGN